MTFGLKSAVFFRSLMASFETCRKEKRNVFFLLKVVLCYVRYDYDNDNDNDNNIDNVGYSFLQGKKKTTAVMPCFYVFISFPLFSVV